MSIAAYSWAPTVVRALIALFGLHVVATQCFGFIVWRPSDVYLPAWRRWLIRRGLLWGAAELRYQEEKDQISAQFFKSWAALCWRFSRLLAAPRMTKGLVWYTSHCMIQGVE